MIVWNINKWYLISHWRDRGEMVDKEGIDGFSHKAVNTVARFFFYNSTIARASSVVMETNVESQLWFCLGSPLGWSSVGTPLCLAFLSGFTSLDSQWQKCPLCV